MAIFSSDQCEPMRRYSKADDLTPGADQRDAISSHDFYISPNVVGGTFSNLTISTYVRFAPIVLKNSKIARLRKSRKCSVLTISAAARLCRIDARASDRFC